MAQWCTLDGGIGVTLSRLRGKRPSRGGDGPRCLRLAAWLQVDILLLLNVNVSLTTHHVVRPSRLSRRRPRCSRYPHLLVSTFRPLEHVGASDLDSYEDKDCLSAARLFVLSSALRERLSHSRTVIGMQRTCAAQGSSSVQARRSSALVIVILS